jgi:hypothetical protein
MPLIIELDVEDKRTNIYTIEFARSKRLTVFEENDPAKIINLGEKIVITDYKFHQFVVRSKTQSKPKYSRIDGFGAGTTLAIIEQPNKILIYGRVLIQGMDFREGMETTQNGIIFRVNLA